METTDNDTPHSPCPIHDTFPIPQRNATRLKERIGLGIIMERFESEDQYEEPWSAWNPGVRKLSLIDKGCTCQGFKKLTLDIEPVFGASYPYDINSGSRRPLQSRYAATDTRNDARNDRPMTTSLTAEHVNTQLDSASPTLVSHDPLAKLLQPKPPHSRHPSPMHGQSLVSNTNTWNFPGLSPADLLNLFQIHGIKTVPTSEPSRQGDTGTNLPYHQSDENKNAWNSNVPGKSKRLELSNSGGIAKPSVTRKRALRSNGMVFGCPICKHNPGRYWKISNTCTSPLGISRFGLIKYVLE
jgi:hypothetical protein